MLADIMTRLLTIAPIDHKAYQPSRPLTPGLLSRLLSLSACLSLEVMLSASTEELNVTLKMFSNNFINKNKKESNLLL